MKKHLEAKYLWNIVANDFEETKNDGELTTTEMKILRLSVTPRFYTLDVAGTHDHCWP